MKFVFALVLAVLLASIGNAPAQVARYYNLFSLADGSTNDLTATLPAATTNQVQLLSSTVTNQYGSPTSTTTITSSNIVLSCHEFDKCGFSFSTTGVTGSSNGLFGVQIYGTSSKGAVWDANPRWNFTTTNTAANAATTYSTNAALDLTGLDRLAFVFLNGSANGYQTNVIAGVLLKGNTVKTVDSAY